MHSFRLYEYVNGWALMRPDRGILFKSDSFRDRICSGARGRQVERDVGMPQIPGMCLATAEGDGEL